MGPPLVTIYLIADVGSIGGGWLSSHAHQARLERRTPRARPPCSSARCAVVPIIFARAVASLWAAVLLVGLAAAAHQGWSANLFTLVSDMFPQAAPSARWSGFGGMCGRDRRHADLDRRRRDPAAHGSYVPIFFMAGFTYLFALGRSSICSCRSWSRRGSPMKRACGHETVHPRRLPPRRTVAPTSTKLVRDLPIVDYHGHLPSEHLAANHRFAHFTEIWLDGDHYKWRAMRANGIPERLITGDGRTRRSSTPGRARCPDDPQSALPLDGDGA